MEVVLIGAGLLYLYYRGSNSFKFPGELAPTSAEQLPPVNRLQPSLNDIVRPPDYWRGIGRNPLRAVGYTERVNGGNVKGDYSQERFLGVTSVDSPFSLHRSQKFADTFSQIQRAHIPDNYFLEQAYKPVGVKPFKKINSSGHPAYLRVMPPK